MKTFTRKQRGEADSLSWFMVSLTLLFICLYGAILTEIVSAPDPRMFVRMERMIFLITGFYFARLAGQQCANNLGQEIIRQTRRADASTAAKEKVKQSNEALEEKIKNVRSVLRRTGSDFGQSEGLRHRVLAARRILRS